MSPEENILSKKKPRRASRYTPSSSSGDALKTILLALSFSHLLNDTIQSLLPAIYPNLEKAFTLNFTQIGLITFTFQLTSSLLQPFVGMYTDRHPKPYSLAIGMGVSLCGLLLLSRAWNFHMILISAALVGVGSSIFHPEASRLARFSSGGRHVFAQSIFQTGGYAGTALGPALAAMVVTPLGQHSIAWFSGIALLAMFVLFAIGRWSKRSGVQHQNKPAISKEVRHHDIPRHQIIFIMFILCALIFSKYVYLVSISSYYTFYVQDRFHLSTETSQWLLFLFLFAVAAGTIIGGIIGDRYGRKLVIWFSILGVAPFTMALPYANLPWTIALSIVIGLILASAFSAIIVYAQELVPGKVGMIGGLFYGFGFGMAGLGAAILGFLKDHTDIYFVYHVCSFLPLIGLLTIFLPNLNRWVADREA
jgi:MFS transporter, FSR family, fosmidomycin resistance protein